ncbi:homogentisate 1,2-dioxygenase domain-containing protein, partial [Methylobacterium oryzisoli]
AFMFETRFPQKVSRFAAETAALQRDYGDYGRALARHFDPNRPEARR